MTIRFMSHLGGAVLGVSALPVPAFCQVAYTHFEARQTHALDLSPDSTRLLAVNTPAGTVSLLDVSASHHAQPILLAEISVGLEPVAVRFRTNDEAWVVSEIGDHVAVVSLSGRCVVDTLQTPDEPSDVVFSNGKAFISCARSNSIRIYDATTRQFITTVALQSLYPSYLAVHGDTVYAASLHSGNRTTILPRSKAPNPPPPTNPSLPPAPKTGKIVPSTHPLINYTVLDNDVAVISAQSNTVTAYFTNIGTNLFGLAVNPAGTELWVPNTEALNLIEFEPNLRGHFADNRVTRVPLPSGGSPVAYDLNPGINYSLLPNPSAQATALAQPVSAVFTTTGDFLWVAAFGSDRLAKLSTVDGSVVQRVDLRPTGDSRQMRGPRSLVWQSAHSRLYCLNKLSNTISVVNGLTGELLEEVPIGSVNPMPPAIREGRGFLFDARLSGNGTASCATCHLDADRDGLAWNLGDPGGEMQTVMGANLSAHDPRLRPRILHPMKGPMTTQTLRGMQAGAPFHWRGDRATLQSFNVTFSALLGGNELPAADINALTTYLLSLKHHPNPNRKLDGGLPPTFAGGNPITGRNLFNLHDNHCGVCHALPTGSDNNLDLMSEVGSSQPLKNPPLRTVYQRMFFNPQSGQNSLSGYGLGHDGSLSVLPTAHPYVLDELGQVNLSDFVNVASFILCFDTGTVPTTGQGRTVTSANATNAALLADLTTLEARAGVADNINLVVHGKIGGRLVRYRYDSPTLAYVPDKTGGATISRAALLASLGGADRLFFLGVPAGSGARYATDRDEDGILNADESPPTLTCQVSGPDIALRWPETFTDWFVETAPDPSGPWQTLQAPKRANGGAFQILHPASQSSRGFFRLRRTW